MWLLGFLFVMALWSFGNVLIKKMNSMNPLALNVPYGFILCVETALMQIGNGDYKPIDMRTFLLMSFFLGVFGFVGQVMFTRMF